MKDSLIKYIIVNHRKSMMILCLCGVIIGFNSCYPGSAFDDDDLDIAVSLYDANANFNNKTFAMPDTVMEIGEGNLALTGRLDELVINQVRSNMVAMGYTEVVDFDNETPDIVVLLSKTSSTTLSVFTYYPIWWDYWGYYPVWPIYGPIGPGYAPYYPWGARSVQSYSTGTMLVEMLDADNLSMPERIPAIWAGAINGLYDRYDPSLESRITQNIDQLFDQSPYLRVQ